MRDFKWYAPNWHKANEAAWRIYLGHLKDQPNVRALEIGSLEGRSAIWLLDNILTHETSSLVMVDPWVEEVVPITDTKDLAGKHDWYRRCLYNMEQSGHGTRCQMIRSESIPQLAEWMAAEERIDFIYVDGSHIGADALCDIVMCWRLLKPGGILIADDYGIKPAKPVPTPKHAVDAFLTCHTDATVLNKGYQVILRKEPT